MGETVRHATASILARTSFHDPDLQALDMVTVSEVVMSPDLKQATAFVSMMGRDDTDDTVAALNRAAGRIRGELGRLLDAKFTPRLRFRRDGSFEEADRVEALIRRNRHAS
ncbi:MAG: 30S ribosome-binding factor RbfA [Alphaproteobacteria bacterium]|nr:30S ribosome-binding factor RbfA [Alphaproteobacteria bacterium]MCY4318250.1 30S ribosome-binding factor RbfA [Alphaproteobacteria bacterium]